ncbi:phosphatidylserine decarboxylase [Hepatocystis sp. ex Piliocolobus tephrosceles]|nr:phosphatidylserine decarboxylase [Hepatocystis sp. ex Piliocolobus tephrosceles]
MLLFNLKNTKKEKDGNKYTQFYKNKYLITGVTMLSILFIFQYKYHEALSVNNNQTSVLYSSKLFWARLLFGRTRSRITGRIMYTEIPTPLRLFLFNSIIKTMGINKEEIKYPLESYKSLGDFFSRYIREETREIKNVSEHSLVSPCDGTITYFGELNSDYIGNVKGLKFEINKFLGSTKFEKKHNDDSTKFYYAILYLSPKEYHHFHAPFNFKYNIRRHISGELFPVFNGMFKIINNLFNINERVVLSGEWKGGNVYYVAVSAFNVGHIRIINDNDLMTNNYRAHLVYMGGDINTKNYENYNTVEIGDEIGEFRLGSSIVLIFEHKKDFKWDVISNQKVFVGQKLGDLANSTGSETKFIKIRSSLN